MVKRKREHGKLFRQMLAYVLTFVMVAGLMPATVAKAEEAETILHDTDLYFVQWDDAKEMTGVSDYWNVDVPDDVGAAWIYAKQDGSNMQYQYVKPSELTVTYCEEIIDENELMQGTATADFQPLAEGQMEQVTPSQEDYNNWATNEISGGSFLPDQTIPVSYYHFDRTGTYKITYQDDTTSEEYSCYLFVTNRAWDFYETDEFSSNPLRDYYYQNITEDTGFYLKQADPDVSLGVLQYDENNKVIVGEDGTPVLAEDNPLMAATYLWDDDTQKETVDAKYTDCISYNDTTGKISIIKDPEDGRTDYILRVYYYITNKYEDENGNPVTEYWQERTEVQIHHGVDNRDTIWLGYDTFNGTVEWKLQGVQETEKEVLEPYGNVKGIVNGVYDVYLTEKPNYPDDFNWEQATQEQRNQYGYREGAAPVVNVMHGNGSAEEYRVDATVAALQIDDCGDQDDATWHFTYPYRVEDGLDIFWSDYDAFLYNDTEQFQIEMGVQREENGGLIRLSQTPAEGDIFQDDKYGEKYNFATTEIGKLSATFTPNDGAVLEEVQIGDVRYVNAALKSEGDSRPSFTPAEDGSYTYTFSETGLKAYHWEGDTKVFDTDENGNPRYASVYIDANYREQHEGGLSQGFSWNVFPETETLAEKGIAGVSYKVNNEEWTTLSKENGDNLNFAKAVDEGDTITVKFAMNEGYTISDTGFGAEYQTDQGAHADYKPVDSEETIEQMIQALIGEDGYTFTFTPEESSKDADGNSTIQAEDAALRLQFNVIRAFDAACNLRIFVQSEAGKTEEGTIIYGETDEEGNYKEGTQPNPEIAFRFNDNPYGGQGVLPEEKENNGENALSIQYISTLPGDNEGKLVEVTPNSYLDFSVGGYTGGDTANEFVIQDDLIDEIYVDANNDGIFSEDERKSPDEDGCYMLSLTAASKYNIFIRKHRSNVATLSWNYIKDNNNPEQDDYVEHGKVYVKEIKRGDEVLLGDMHLDADGKVILDGNGLPIYDTLMEDKLQYGLSGLSGTGGTIWTENGDEVTLLLVPTYGYQLKSATINGQEGQPQEEVSTFKITLNGNLHFGGVFEEAQDKTDVTKATEVSAATIANGENAADSGNLSLTVADNTSYTKDVTASVKAGMNKSVEKVASLDLTLDNIVSKGEENGYWTSNVTSFEKDITVGLTLDDLALAEGESLSVVRDHEGTLTELKVEYEATTKMLSFQTNQFSTYTIVKKVEKQTPTAPQVHKHTLVKTEEKAATCVAAGNKAYWTCSECGKVYSDAEGKTETTVAAMTITATGHSWDNGTVTQEATATQDGVKTYHCTNTGCTETKTEAIPATGVPTTGTEIKDEKGTASYKVTGTDVKNPTVTYTGTTDSKATTVTVPATVTVEGVTYKVTAVADNAFKGNKKITKVTIPKNVTTIGKNAFSGCTKLKAVTVGSDVTTIGTNAFKGCKALTKITLPGKTVKIEANAFSGCKKLKTIVIKSKKLTSKSISKNAFKGISATTIIKVPKGKNKAYKALLQKKGLSKKVKVTN